jgi:hypothetical protein
MNLKYRNFTPADIAKIIRFWNENSGWEDSMNIDEFNLRFRSSPFGDPIIMLAIDDDNDEVVGQFSFLPVSVTINTRPVRGYRPFGAIFKESLRDRFGIKSFLTGKHPVLVLYNKGAEEARKNGAAITYLLPDPRWGKILSVLPIQTCQFPLWSCRIPMANPAIENIDCRPVYLPDAAVDQLWEETKLLNQCSISRDSISLQAKNRMRQGAFKFMGVFVNQQLCGFFSLRFKAAEFQWMIGDLLTRDSGETLKLTLQAACLAAKREYRQIRPAPDKSYKVAILATPVIQKLAEEVGFYKENYQFFLAVHLLDRQFKKSEVAPERWYVSDSD